MTPEQNNDRTSVVHVAMTRGEWDEAIVALNGAQNLIHGSGNYPFAAAACALDLARITTILSRAT